MPSEISIPKDDDILVESTENDFMDSVKDTTEESNSFESFDSEITPVDDIPSELPETEDEDSDIPTVDQLLSETDTAVDFTEETEETEEVPTIENNMEPVIEETAVDVEETPVEVEESPVEESKEDVSFAEVDNLDNSISESNLNYLTAKEEPVAADTITGNSDLKQDIKSVLLYMDQLLENLPEEKIVEFAKSDEFTTYKKLFSELGLS